MDGVVVVVGADAAGASVVAAVEYAVGLVGEGGSEEAGDEDCLSSSKRLDNLCLRPNRMEEPLQLAEFRLVTAAMEPLTCKDGHCVAASHRNDEFWGVCDRAGRVGSCYEGSPFEDCGNLSGKSGGDGGGDGINVRAGVDLGVGVGLWRSR